MGLAREEEGGGGVGGGQGLLAQRVDPQTELEGMGAEQHSELGEEILGSIFIVLFRST